MSSTTSWIEVEATTPNQTAPERCRTEPSKRSARGRIAAQWPLVTMIASVCLFAVVFAAIVLHPAIKTVTQSAGHNWSPEGP